MVRSGSCGGVRPDSDASQPVFVNTVTCNEKITSSDVSMPSLDPSSFLFKRELEAASKAGYRPPPSSSKDLVVGVFLKMPTKRGFNDLPESTEYLEEEWQTPEIELGYRMTPWPEPGA